MSAPELSVEEAAIVYDIDRAPAAPESWDRVRMSPDGRDVAVRRGPNDWRVSNGGHYLDVHVADWTPMQVAVLSGPSSDAEQAVERVLALADRHEECCSVVNIASLREAVRGD